MRSWLSFAVAAAVLVLPGCYHQVVRTGAAPGTVTVERPWTATYFFGLVPATAINTAAECPAGVAVVETEQSFLNGLVGALTLGIYTPQTVSITCAAAASAMTTARQIVVPADAGMDDRAAGIRAAIDLAQMTGETVAVYTAR
jgi:hypothetical protein